VIRPAELIERKRDGGELSADELKELMLGYARDEVPDYQLAAFCMAVFFKGLSGSETYALTEAMIETGETIDLRSALGRKVVDKHSTGGVGDKTSIAVGPIVAACDVPFAKMSGRGLGHTGGTLDKLESIPGFRVELSTEELVEQVRDAGMAIVGAGADLVPADKRLYALRDVTATVDSLPLIASSIVSKKIAAGAEAIVFDVKVGEGAFMKSLEDARALAEMMRELAGRFGRETACLLTDMDQPLGAAVGNALEIREALATLHGKGPPDFTELVTAASVRLLALSDLELAEPEARERVADVMADGSAVHAYERWIEAQGGDPDAAALPKAPVLLDVAAPASAYVAELHSMDVGRAALHLGAGRQTKEDLIDHAVGVICIRKRGDRVEQGEPLAQVHARTDETARSAADQVLAAYELAEEPPPERRVVLEAIG
jgi:pyrimidine-nucleoside phosphorylase